MRRIVKLIGFVGFLSLFLAGCAATEEYCASEDKIKEVKTYQSSSDGLKDNLFNDLRSGKVSVGQTLDYIRSAYGDPDNMLVTGCSVRISYKLKSAHKIYLWFNDGEHLSVWED